MTKESKDLTVKKTSEVSTEVLAEFDGLGFGAGDTVDSDDIIIPKLQLTQPLSDAVAEKLATAGEYFDSVEKKALGEELEIIVLKGYKTWQEFTEVKDAKGKTKMEYQRTIDYVGNESLPFDEPENGIHRDMVIGYYVLLLDDILNGIAFPYAVDFKRTSRQAGKQLATYCAKLRKVKRPSFSKVFKLGVKYVQDEHNYYVKTVSMGRDLTAEEAPAVVDWVKELVNNAQKYQADDSDVKEESKPIEVEAEAVDDLPF